MNLMRKSVIALSPQSDQKQTSWDASLKMLLLIDEMNNLSIKTKEVLDAQFVTHLPTNSLERFCFEKTSKRLQNEYRILSDDFNISDNTDIDPNTEKVFKDLEDSHSNFQTWLQLVSCSKDMSRASVAMRRYQLDIATDIFDGVLTTLNDLRKNDSWREVACNMRKVASLKRSMCVSKLCSEWEECLLWEEKQSIDKVKLTISIKESDVSYTKMIMQALSKAKQLEMELVPFSNFFNKILSVLLSKYCVISCDEYINFVHLVIEHSFKDEKNLRLHVFIENLMVVFEFLQLKLNFEFDNGESFFGSLAKLISKEFFCLIDKHFSDVVPSTMTDVKDFEEIISKIQLLNNFLIQIKFTDMDNSPLNKYIHNMEDLIRGKKCEEYMMEAKNILMTNFQANLMTLGSQDNNDKIIFSDSTALEMPFLLSKVKISASVKELVRLVLKCLREATKSTSQLAAVLVLTAKNMISLYGSLVPECQSQCLQNSALDVALFYNNCYYLSHFMLSAPWGIELDINLRKSLNIFMANEINITRNIGDSIFADFLKTENKFIADKFAEVDAKNVDFSSGLPELDEAVCAVQTRLSSLQRQWLSVLSTEAYSKTMEDLLKTLAHSALDCLFRINQEGLAMESANALAMSLEPVMLTPKIIFKEDAKSRKSYSKLNEAVQLLSYPRRAVFEERIATGSVFKSFTKAETKFLIKLVFPVGANRSALIGKLQ